MDARTVFIGDVHGCSVEFRELLGKIGFRNGRDRLLLTGDAFTRGPGPLDVWRTISGTGADMVLGNHDERLIRRAHDPAAHPDKPNLARTLEQLRSAPEDVLSWLETRPLWIETESFLLVHAGIHPEKGLEGTTREQFLSIRTWPPTGGTEGPRWHDAYRPGKKVLIFGHDAPGGLVVKRRPDGSPYLIGLDSGCIYGRQLSAYLLEEDRIVQVDSHRGRSWNAPESA